MQPWVGALIGLMCISAGLVAGAILFGRFGPYASESLVNLACEVQRLRDSDQRTRMVSLAVLKAALLQDRSNADLRSEVRELRAECGLKRELDQAKHVANFVNIDDERIA